MARHKWSTPELRNIEVFSNEDDWNELRNHPALIAHLEGMGTEWVGELNSELRAAQTARKQPVEDGYEKHVNPGRTRARMFIVAKTARAQAHEAKHNSILKRMKTSGHQVKKGEGTFKNPTKGWRVHGTDEQDNPIVGLD